MTLSSRRCAPCKPGTPPLDPQQIARLSAQTPDWELAPDGKSISRSFSFPNFHLTLGFVNAVAFIANREDHHPDLEVSFGRCRVRYWTHTVGGLSENDFIAAAKIDALLTGELGTSIA